MDFNLEGNLAAFLSIFIAVFTALLGKLFVGKEKHKRKKAESELKFQSAALDFGMFVSEWNEVIQEIKTLIEETEVERFILFRAFNGLDEPRWTTGVLQIRSEHSKVISYVHYELDSDYLSRLKFIENKNYDRLIVKDLPDHADIKLIYQNEGLTDSFWAFLNKSILEGTDAAVVSYCSFATSQESGLTEETITKCKIITGRLKGCALSFIDKVDV